MKEKIAQLKRLKSRILLGALLAIVLLVAALALIRRAPTATFVLFAMALVWQLFGMRWLKKGYRRAYMRLYALEGTRNLIKNAQYAPKDDGLADLPVRLGLLTAQELLPNSVHYHVLRGSIRSKAAIMEETAFAYRQAHQSLRDRASFAGTLVHIPGWKKPGLIAAVGNPFPSLPATQRLSQRGYVPAVLPEGCELPQRTVLLMQEGAQVSESLLQALDRFAAACAGPSCLMCTQEGLTLMLGGRFFTAEPSLRTEPEAAQFGPLNLEDIQQGLRLAEAFEKQ